MCRNPTNLFHTNLFFCDYSLARRDTHVGREKEEEKRKTINKNHYSTCYMLLFFLQMIERKANPKKNVYIKLNYQFDSTEVFNARRKIKL